MDNEDDEMKYISLLVDNLNELLYTLNIHLSIPIESPMDLTPSLLIVILESLLGARIPIEAYTYPHTHTGFLNVATINRIQSMKLFLCVLEHDVLGIDVGLSDIDPRRLARGEWEEVVYVAEVLCWIGVWLREEEDEDETTAVFELEKGFVDEVGLGIYESYSPSLLSNYLGSDLELNASFTQFDHGIAPVTKAEVAALIPDAGEAFVTGRFVASEDLPRPMYLEVLIENG